MNDFHCLFRICTFPIRCTLEIRVVEGSLGGNHVYRRFTLEMVVQQREGRWFVVDQGTYSFEEGGVVGRDGTTGAVDDGDGDEALGNALLLHLREQVQEVLDGGLVGLMVADQPGTHEVDWSRKGDGASDEGRESDANRRRVKKDLEGEGENSSSVGALETQD
jgi:hypothetical protein